MSNDPESSLSGIASLESLVLDGSKCIIGGYNDYSQDSSGILWSGVSSLCSLSDTVDVCLPKIRALNG